MSFRLLFIVFLLFVCIGLFAQTPHLDSLKAVRNSTADSSLLAGQKHLSLSETGKAFLALKKARLLYKQAGNKTGLADVSLAFSKYYEKNFLWPEAENYYQDALSLLPADSLHTRADIEFNLARVLYEQEKYGAALKYDQQALGYFSSNNLKGRMAETYVQIARIRIAEKNFTQAESLILKHALPLFRSASNEFGRISAFDVLGKSYYGQKKYSPAKWFFIQANTQSRNLKDTTGIISSLIELGKVKVDIKDYDLAIRDFKEAESLSRKTHALSLAAEVKKAYGILYKKTGNKKSYASYTAAYNTLNDSLEGIQSEKTLASKKAETDADQFLKNAAIVKKSSPQKADNFYLYLVSGLTILIIITGICLYMIRNRKFKRS